MKRKKLFRANAIISMFFDVLSIQIKGKKINKNKKYK